jgi:hypothetical protein
MPNTQTLTYLQGEDANPASLLRKDNHPWHGGPALQAVKPISRGQRCATERSRLQKVQVLGHRHKSVLIKDAVLPRATISRPTKASCGSRWCQGAVNMALVEQYNHIVTCSGIGLGPDRQRIDRNLRRPHRH